MAQKSRFLQIRTHCKQRNAVEAAAKLKAEEEARLAVRGSVSSSSCCCCSSCSSLLSCCSADAALPSAVPGSACVFPVPSLDLLHPPSDLIRLKATN